jgi:hypothetical protein
MSLSKAINTSYERPSDQDDPFEHELDSEDTDADIPEVKGNKHKPFSYDHPVLRRIEGIAVFYISAIAEIGINKENTATPENFSKYIKL